MHDDQHVVRLFLLDKGIQQGYLYPRWVDTLTFGFGDPLFNFYPPLVYYLAELFHLIGFSLISSVLIVFALGFVLAAWGMYLLAREYVGRWGAIASATLYTYFSYHAVNAYVRGALAEFFAMSIVPFCFYFLTRLYRKLDLKNAVYFGISFAALILTHQLIALPFMFFLAFALIYFWSLSKEKVKFFKKSTIGIGLGLGLSAFYWLPAFVERSVTFLSQELGGYKLHYIFPKQLWHSPWGFGGSIEGALDGMSFQLGKIYVLLVLLSLGLSAIYFVRKKLDSELGFYFFFALNLLFGLFMTTPYSAVVWDNFKLLWNLQFPWRFMAINAVFISLLGGYVIYFLPKVFKLKKTLVPIIALLISAGIVFQYSKYFRPQQFTKASDKDLTTFEEIAWRQSLTVLHFVPKGVKSTQNQYGVYVLDIKKEGLPAEAYEIKLGNADVKTLENKYQDKKFEINAPSPVVFQLNTFHFPGWKSYLDQKEVLITDNNDYKLINIHVPEGKHILEFRFENTPARAAGNLFSVISLGAGLVLLKLQ